MGEIAKTYSGGTPSISNKKFYINGHIPFIKSGEIGSTRTEQKINYDGLNNSSARLIETGTLLYALYGATSGKAAISPIDGAINQAVLAIIPQNNVNRFIYEWLNKNKSRITGKYLQGGQGNLSAKIIKQINIYITSKNEELKISNILRIVNKIISLQQRKLKLLKEIRKGIVENIRDNNFEYKEQKNDFKDVKIKDMFKITRGKVLPKEKISSNKISPNIYPVFSSQTLNNGLLGFYKDYLFQNAITWTTDGANAGTVNFRNEKFYSTNVNGVLLQKKIKPDLLTADLLNLVAFKYVSKVGNPKLMNNTMANIRIKIPSNTNARIFYSKILNKCDTKIDFINKKIDYLTTFKRFLLQNMFI